MFKRFIDLSSSESVPDHSMIVAVGSINIIDATVIEARQSRQRRGTDGSNTQDKEAAYPVQAAADGKKKTTYGFKMHANTAEDGWVKNMTCTPGNVHDSKEFNQLLDVGKTQDGLKPVGRYMLIVPIPTNTTIRNLAGTIIQSCAGLIATSH